jgi:carbonic anhydrase
VPANQIVGLLPGDVFVHRNIANMVVHTDLNCLSVMQFAVDILKVKHVIVVGHYGCSGVQAAMRRARVGLADNWLRHVQDVHEKHEHTCATASSENAARPAVRAQRDRAGAERLPDRIARDAWERGQELHVHGWIYGIADGLARDLARRCRTSAKRPRLQALAKLARPRA